MSEQEQKAIEYLKTYMLPYFRKGKEIEFYLNDVLLNLIERQQKEFEDLRDYMDSNYISKNKIIAALGYQKDDEEYETMNEEKILSLISTLMSEVDRLENLEDDLTTVYLNGVYDGEKKVKDKIRGQIKELKNIIEFEKPTYEDCLEYTIDILEDLLGE